MRKIAAALFVIACGLRLAFIIYAGSGSIISKAPGAERFNDAWDYHHLACNLLRTGVYGYGSRPSSYRPPGYPVFIAAIYSLTGERPVMIQIVQVLLGACSCLLIFYLAWKISGKRAALISGLLATVYPFFIFFNAQIMSESLFMFLFLVMLAALMGWYGTGMIRWVIFSGIAAGAGCLTRGILQGLLPVVAGWLVYTVTDRKKGLLAASMFITAAGLTILPWTLRNYPVHQAWVRISTNGGYNFYLGNVLHAQWSGRDYRGVDDVRDPSILNDTDMEREHLSTTEKEAERRAWQEGLHYVKRHPAAFIKTYLLKIRDLWWVVTAARYPLTIRIIVAVIYVLILFSALYGILAVTEAGKKEMIILYIALTVMTTFVVGLFITNIRMRIPLIDPILIVLAGTGIDRMLALRSLSGHG